MRSESGGVRVGDEEDVGAGLGGGRGGEGQQEGACAQEGEARHAGDCSAWTCLPERSAVTLPSSPRPVRRPGTTYREADPASRAARPSGGASLLLDPGSASRSEVLRPLDSGHARSPAGSGQRHGLRTGRIDVVDADTGPASSACSRSERDADRATRTGRAHSCHTCWFAGSHRCSCP